MNRTNGFDGKSWDVESRVSRAEAIARTLEAEILEGSLAPGERIGTKSELRGRLNVAAGTLNEALRLLEMRAVIQLRPGPGGGVFAATPSSQVRLSQLVLGFRSGASVSADCLIVRDALELPIALDAAKYRKKADLNELRKILDQMEEAESDPLSFLKANWALHRRIATISPNAVLTSIYLTLLDILESELQAVSPADTFRAASNVEVHSALIASIADQDPSVVRKAVRRHSPSADLVRSAK